MQMSRCEKQHWSQYLNKYIKLDEREQKVNQILNDIKEITERYQTSRAKVLPNSSKNQIKNTAQNLINSETYATNPDVVKGVSNKFKKIFNCKQDLSTVDVKQLLMSDASTKKNILSSIIDKYKIKKKNTSSLFSSTFQNNETKLDPSACFLSYIEDSIIAAFHESLSNKKETILTNKIFSNRAVELIKNYLIKNYKPGTGIDFANDLEFKKEKEILDNHRDRFSLQQINKMLNSGVSPDCLLAITNFDVYIKLTCEYLDDDIKNGGDYLCRQFIDFLYMYIDKGCMNKTNPQNKLTPKFTQNLISKYIKDKKLNNLEQIENDPVIYSLFFQKDGSLRNKEQINKLLGSDEEIFEMFMNAKIDEMLLVNILNINGILWEFSDDWLNKIGNHDYSNRINFSVSQKKLMTFKLVNLLDDGKNETLNKLLKEKTVKCDDKKFFLNQNQIAQTKAIRFIVQDLETIKNYLNPNDEKNKACLKVLEKSFSHQFWFDNLADINFFTQLVTFLKQAILVDELNEQDINEITTVDELKNILNKATISHLFKNVKSGFVMGVLLDSVLGDYLNIGNFTAWHFAEIFEEVFEKAYGSNKAIDFKDFKKVFIKTFVAKTKDMKRANFLIKDESQTVLQFVLDQMEQINQLLKEKNKEYTFDDDEIDYFSICLGIIENEANHKEFLQNRNVIHEQD